jgi:hypothetical protein
MSSSTITLVPVVSCLLKAEEVIKERHGQTRSI